MEILFLILGVYFVLAFITALFLTQLPSSNGFIKNMFYAPLYWIAAARGRV